MLGHGLGYQFRPHEQRLQAAQGQLRHTYNDTRLLRAEPLSQRGSRCTQVSSAPYPFPEVKSAFLY